MRFAIIGTKIDNFYNQLLQEGFIYDKENPEVVFSLGGDGTMLISVAKYADKNPLFVGVNKGKLGFYTDYEEKEFDLIIESLKQRKFSIHKFHLLEWNNMLALNEMTIINPIHTQIIEVYLNGKLLETFRGTGLLISTPSGSTAYNKSLGGSVVDPSIEAFQLTEIASINNRVYKSLGSSLVLSNETKLVLKSDFSETFITIDGRKIEQLDNNEISIKLSDIYVRLVAKEDKDFWDRVRNGFLN